MFNIKMISMSPTILFKLIFVIFLSGAFALMYLNLSAFQGKQTYRK